LENGSRIRRAKKYLTTVPPPIKSFTTPLPCKPEETKKREEQ
jgi:hypothetical protein